MAGNSNRMGDTHDGATPARSGPRGTHPAPGGREAARDRQARADVLVCPRPLPDDGLCGKCGREAA